MEARLSIEALEEDYDSPNIWEREFQETEDQERSSVRLQQRWDSSIFEG